VDNIESRLQTESFLIFLYVNVMFVQWGWHFRTGNQEQDLSYCMFLLMLSNWKHIIGLSSHTLCNSWPTYITDDQYVRIAGKKIDSGKNFSLTLDNERSSKNTVATVLRPKITRDEFLTMSKIWGECLILYLLLITSPNQSINQ